MFAFKDSTAIHWLVALINKKSSQSKKQDQRKKKEKERKVNRLVLSGRILHKSLNFIIKSYITIFFTWLGCLIRIRYEIFWVYSIIFCLFVCLCFAYLFVCVLFYMFVCQQENDIHPSWECGITNSLDIFQESIRQSL